MTQTRILLGVLIIATVVAYLQPPVLFFDANTQDDNDEPWTNSGSAGGRVPQTDGQPKLEEGIVEVAGASFFTKYYTVQESGRCSANDEPPEVFLYRGEHD